MYIHVGIPGRNGSRAYGKIAWMVRDLAITREIPSRFTQGTLRPVTPRVDKKRAKTKDRGIPHCIHFAADKMLARYSLVAEGFIARWLEPALA